MICINNRHFSWIRFHSCDDAPRLNTALKPHSSLLLYRHTQYIVHFLARRRTTIERENDCKFITITQRKFQAYDVQKQTEIYNSDAGTAVAKWLRRCSTNRKVAGSIPDGVSGFFIDIKSFRSHYGPGVESASKRNEYQEYFLGVKAAGA